MQLGKKSSLQVTRRQHKYMHALQFFLQIVSMAFNRTCMCNVTWWSFTFLKNLISSFHSDSDKSLMLKIHTYINKYIHAYTHAYVHSSELKNRCPLCCYQQLLVLPGFLLSWPFITEAGVCPQADISTSTHQVSTVSLLWHSCSRWCKWPGT